MYYQHGIDKVQVQVNFPMHIDNLKIFHLILICNYCKSKAYHADRNATQHIVFRRFSWVPILLFFLLRYPIKHLLLPLAEIQQ